MERRCPICGEAGMVEAKARTEDASGGGDDLVTFRVLHCESGKCEDTNVFEPVPPYIVNVTANATAATEA